MVRRRAQRDPAKYRAALEAAAARGALSRLPAHALHELIDRGIRLDARARTVVYREDDPPAMFLVVHGTARIFVSADDGREFTVFWAHPGEWLGLDLIAGGPIDVSVQALSDTTLHVLPIPVLEAIVRRDAAAAWALLQGTSARLRQTLGFLRMLAFMDLRERVSQRLLEFAFHQPSGTPLVAQVTQQDLADLVGSPRTSVARILAQLREENVIRTVPRGIEVLRPERLTQRARRPTGTT